MADKDVGGILAGLECAIDNWYVTEVNDSRCMTAAELTKQTNLTIAGKVCASEKPIYESYNQACTDAEIYSAENPGQETLVVVTGSFHTVSALRELSVKDDLSRLVL